MNEIVPWLPFDAIEYLRDLLRPWVRTFEWGSGESTVFFAKRVAEVISVEHEFKSHRDTMALLAEHGLTAKIHLIPPEDKAICNDPSSPACYYSAAYPDKNFKRYVSVIDRYKGFDIVLVDGRARPSCLEHGYKKVLPSGFLILDNSDRVYYTVPIEVQMMWEKTTFFGHGPYNDYPWECTFWQRPIED